MFTGIVTDLGLVRVVEIERSEGSDRTFVFDTHYDTASIAVGSSIACCGCCLTVIDRGDNWFAVQVSLETLSCTTLGLWKSGTPVNFERALRLGDELGGHIVLGHIDGVAKVTSLSRRVESLHISIMPPRLLMPYIALKGSVTLDGVSLTVIDVQQPDRFCVNVIPYTQSRTTFGQLCSGDSVNIEVDMLARYVARLLEKD